MSNNYFEKLIFYGEANESPQEEQVASMLKDYHEIYLMIKSLNGIVFNTMN